MNIQIYGKNKCFDTKKAQRWFQERRVKFQEIDRLWQAWSAMDPKPDPEIWLAEALAELKSQQSLPGLGPNLWMVVTPYNERYILAFADNQWAICPAENLQESA